MTADYATFLAHKQRAVELPGRNVELSEIHPLLHPLAERGGAMGRRCGPCRIMGRRGTRQNGAIH